MKSLPSVKRLVSTAGKQCLRCGSAAVALFATAGFGTQAFASTYYWDTTTTNTWVTGADWSNTSTSGGTTGTVPGSTDTAVFNQSSVNGAEIVQLNASTTIGGITFANTGTTLIESTTTTTEPLTIGTGGITLNSGAGAVTLGAAANPVTLTLGNSQAWTIPVGSSLTLAGSNTISMGTNAVTVNGGGTLTVGYLNTASVSGGSTGGWTFYGSALSLTAADNVNFAAQTNVMGTGPLTMNGGSMTISAPTNNTGNEVQTFSGLTLNAGSVPFITGGRGGSSGYSVGFSALTRNDGAVADFGVGSFSSGKNFGNSAVCYGVAGSAVPGFLTFGANDWLKEAGAAFQVGAATYTNDTWAPGDNTTVTTNDTPATSSTTSTLRFNAAGAFTINLSGTNIITTGGMLVGSTAGANNETITGGSLTSGNTNADGTHDLVVINNNTTAGSNLVINSNIINNGANAVGLTAAITTTAAVSGAVEFGGTNTFTGQSYIDGAKVILESSNAWNGQAPLTFAPESTLSQTTNVGSLTLNGFNATTGLLSTSQSLLTSPVVQDASATSATLGINTASTGTFGGTLQNGSGVGTLGITMSGGGTETLSGTNTYTGTTTVNGGTLQAGIASVANTSGAFGNNSALVMGNIAGATLNITGFNTQIGSLTGGGSTGGNVVLGSATLSVGGNNTSPAAYAGAISGAGNLTKIGTGTLTLAGANAYTGLTTVSTGTLALVSGGSLANTAATVNSGATLAVTPGSNGNINIGTTGATLTLSGSSLLNLIEPLSTDTLDTLTLNSTAATGAGTVLTVGGASSAAVLNFDLSSAGSEELVINEGKTAFNADGGKILITDLDTNNPQGSYTLVSDPSGGLAIGTNGGADFWLGATGLVLGQNNYLLSLSLNSGSTALILNVTAVRPDFYWTGNSNSGSWATIGNFATDSTGATAQTGTLNVTSNVFLTATSASHLSQTLDGNDIINSLSFTGSNTAGTNPVSLAAGSGTSLQINGANPFVDENNTTYPFETGLVVQPGAAADSISANVILGSSQTWDINNSSSNPLTVSGVISDSGSNYALTVNGVGKLLLSGSNTYGGGTTINGGTVALGITNALATTGALTVSGSGTFDLAGNNQTLGSLSDGGVSTGTITTSTGASTLTLNNGAASTFSGTITDNNAGNGASLALNLQGSSIVTLSGSNSFTGGTTLVSGSLIVANDYGLGSPTSTNLNAGLNFAAGSGTATAFFTSANPMVDGITTSSGVGNIVLGNVAGSGSATTLNVGWGGNISTGVYTVSGVISDQSLTKSTAIGNLNVYNGAEVILANANTFTGVTTITGSGNGFQSELVLGNSLALQDSTLNYNNQGGLFSFGTISSVTLGGLEGAENLPLLTSGSAGVALTVGNNNGSTTYSGNLSGGTTLNKVGTGTLILTGSDTFSGTVTSSAGALSVNTGGYLSGVGVNTAEVTGAGLVDNGGTITSSALSTMAWHSSGLLVEAGTTNYNAGLQTDPSSSVNSDIQITITGGVLNASAITLGRGGAADGTQPTAGVTTQFYINGGSVNITGGLGVGSLGTNGVLANSTASARMDSGSLTVGGTVHVEINSGGRWSVLDINGGTFTSTGAVVLGGVQYAGNDEFLVRSGTSTVQEVQFGQGNIAGTSVLNQTGGSLYIGSGGLVQTSTNVTANVDLSGGTLGASAPWSTSLLLTLTNTTTIQTANAAGTAENITLTGFLEGGGGFTKTGAGTLTLTAPSGYSGITTITAGILNINGQFALGGADYGGLTFNGGTLQYLANLTGTNGNGDISQSSLAVAKPVTISAGGATIDTNGNAITYADGIGNNGSGALNVVSSLAGGKLTLGSTNTYTGATNINSGTLVVSGSITGTASASVASAGTLEVDGLLNNSATTTVNGGKLQGTGSVGAISLNSAATLAAGLTNASGFVGGASLTAGNVTFSDSTSTLSIGLGLTTGSDTTSLASSGTVTLDNTPLALTIGNAMTAADQGLLYIILNGGAGATGSGTDVFSYNGVALGNNSTFTTAGGYTFQVLYGINQDNSGSGSDAALELQVVPEPGTWGLMMGGLGLLAFWQRSRRSALRKG